MDKISCLPDEVICHILSFLPTKLSVQTSALSKRWRFLWVHVPSLEFEVDDTVNSKIVTKILLQHKHDIHTFHLRDTYLDVSQEEFESWIVNLTTHNIRKLVIFLYYQFDLPRCLFTCKTLVDLSLTYCVVSIPTNGLYFPALKKLKLDCVSYESNELFSHLISSCPVLEELALYWIVVGHCCVSSPTLTRLVLKSYVDESSVFGVKLDTPALRYLWLHCSMPDILSVGTLDSLTEADISIYWDQLHQDNFIYSRNVLAFLDKLYNVKLLKFSAHDIAEVHDSAFFASTAKFRNLNNLKLCSNFGLITNFLENAINLQVLKITSLEGDIDDQFGWMEPKQVPACLMSHLQIVNVYFSGSKDMFNMVSYILMNAKVLKMMKIRNESRKRYWKKKFEALERRALSKRRLKNATLCSLEIV